MWATVFYIIGEIFPNNNIIASLDVRQGVHHILWKASYKKVKRNMTVVVTAVVINPIGAGLRSINTCEDMYV